MNNQIADINNNDISVRKIHGGSRKEATEAPEAQADTVKEKDMSSALPQHLRIHSLSTNLTVREKLHYVTENEVDADDEDIKAGTEKLPQRDLLCKVSHLEPLVNAQLDK